MHNKVGVHGHGPWQERRHQSWKKPPSNRTAGRRYRSFGVAHGDVALVSSAGRSPYHQSGNSWACFAWRCFVDCFIHENGNDSTDVITLWRVWDFAGAQSPCALCRKDRAGLGREVNPREAGGLAKPLA